MKAIIKLNMAFYESFIAGELDKLNVNTLVRPFVRAPHTQLDFVQNHG